jgi:Zn-dependent membrane protease YugP
MKRLPLIATLFMTGIILNCLRQLLAWSVILTREVLVSGSVICFSLVTLALWWNWSRTDAPVVTGGPVMRYSELPCTALSGGRAGQCC